VSGKASKKMKFTHPNVIGFEIKRRTFEGETNPDKNNNSLTSKYMSSYKYWLRIDYENYSSENCYSKKSECQQAVETAKQLAGKSL